MRVPFGSDIRVYFEIDIAVPCNIRKQPHEQTHITNYNNHFVLAMGQPVVTGVLLRGAIVSDVMFSAQNDLH